MRQNPAVAQPSGAMRPNPGRVPSAGLYASAQLRCYPSAKKASALLRDHVGTSGVARLAFSQHVRECSRHRQAQCARPWCIGNWSLSSAEPLAPHSRSTMCLDFVPRPVLSAKGIEQGTSWHSRRYALGPLHMWKRGRRDAMRHNPGRHSPLGRASCPGCSGAVATHCVATLAASPSGHAPQPRR